MSAQSLDLLESSEAIDDSYRSAAGDWGSAPKDLTCFDSTLSTESPRSVASCVDAASISSKEGAAVLKRSSSRGVSSVNNLPHTGTSKRRNEKSPKSGKSRSRQSVKLLASQRRELALDCSMEDSSRRSEGMEESRRQRSSRSSNGMDDSRSSRRSKEMDDSHSRPSHRKSERSMNNDDSTKRGTRRSDRSGASRRPTGSRTLESRLREGGTREGGTSVDGRSMCDSSQARRERGDRDRERSPRRQGTGRAKMRGSSSRNLMANLKDSSGNNHSGDAASVHSGEGKPRSSRTLKTMEDGSGEQQQPRLKKSGTEAGIRRSGTRARRAHKMDGSDGTRERGDRRMSDNSKARRERKEGRRSSTEDRERRMSDSNRRDGSRRNMDESSRRRRRDGENRRSRRARQLRDKDTYIPPPSAGGEGEEGDHENDEDFSGRTQSGPVDEAPTQHRRSRRQSRMGPLDVPPMLDSRGEEDEEEEEEQIFETTWQRSAPGPRGRRRTSMMTPSSAPSPATQSRRPGRQQRGANVRQSQLVNMVLLHEEEEQAEKEEAAQVYIPSTGESHNLGDLAEGEEEEGERTDLDLSGSEHQKDNVKKISKAAKKGAKSAAKASAAAAKSAGKASYAAAKGLKGVLGFGKKKKPLAYAEGGEDGAGLAYDLDGEGSEGDGDTLSGWDAQSNTFHDSGGTNLHDSASSLNN